MTDMKKPPTQTVGAMPVMQPEKTAEVSSGDVAAKVRDIAARPGTGAILAGMVGREVEGRQQCEAVIFELCRAQSWAELLKSDRLPTLLAVILASLRH